MGTIQPSSRLMVGTTDLTDNFQTVMDILEEARIDKNPAELLQLDVVRLRLYRWRNAVAHLDPSLDANLLANEDGTKVQNYLRSTARILKAVDGSTAIPPAPYAAITEDHWLSRVLQDLCEYHGAPICRPPLAHKGPRGTDTRAIPKGIVSWIDYMELHSMRAILGKLRSNDVAKIIYHDSASKHDIELLRQIASEWDREFSRKLTTNAGHIYTRTKLGGESSTMLGDHVASDYHGAFTGVGNSYEEVNVADKAKGIIGNSYGGKGVFD